MIAGLTVDPARMRANLDATRGAIFAERVMLRRRAGARARSIARARGRDTRRGTGRRREPLPTWSESQAELAQAVPADVLSTLDDPDAYLGAAETLRQRLLAAAGPALDPR